MRCLLIDQEAMGLDLVLRLIAHGHEVRWFRWSPKRPIRDGEGFPGVKIVDDWRPSMAWVGKDGLVWTSGNCRFMQELDRFREFGFRIFSPTARSAELEIKRNVGMEAMRAAGIEIPPYETFDSLQAAARFARKSDRSWVFKTMGDEDDKSLTYVASDPADLTGWIEQKIKRGMTLKGPCMLQEKIDLLAEIGVSGWFGPDGFLPDKWQVCFENKRLMNGDIGPNTGEQGTVTQYVTDDKLADEMLKPMEPILRVSGHRGDFAIGAGIDRKGRAFPMEFTARCGWPAWFIQTASHFGDPAQWMCDLLDGKDTLKVSRDVAIGVVMAQPRYPYNCSAPEMVEGNPISGVEPVLDDLHMVSVMAGKGPRMKDGAVVDGPIYQTSGEYVLVATGLGKTVELARKRVYSVVDRVRFANKMYRTDIGASLEKTLPELHKHGWAKDMEFA